MQLFYSDFKIFRRAAAVRMMPAACTAVSRSPKNTYPTAADVSGSAKASAEAVEPLSLPSEAV